MADRGKWLEQKTRGERAKRIIEDSLVVEVIDSLEKSFMDAIVNSKSHETDVRERAYLLISYGKCFQEQFRQMIVTGKSAGKDLEKLLRK
jgi:hypothetical protein